MQTEHVIRVDDAADMDSLEDDSVELVVTSPPYPMIEMWDGLFSGRDPAVGDALDAGDGHAAFEAMHDQLDAVWAEVTRVLAPGGIACINVGDATRTLDGEFRVYQNHAEVVRRVTAHGLRPLPDIVWRKPSNSLTKFMGSGMVPTNAYATLEHEYLLVFRNGSARRFRPHEDRRYESAYFWEERNEWFSDVWTDVRGVTQGIEIDGARDRSAAYPFEIPYRLVSMYSVYGDTVLDPFWGTGTTSLAAMVAGRNSVGYELDSDFLSVFAERVGSLTTLSEAVVDGRLDAHRSFVAERRADGSDPRYEATHYDFPVVTRQERDIRLYVATVVERLDGDEVPPTERYRVDYAPAGDAG
ncbi:MAG: DNA-methyltransferase [Halobacteriota archaeon]